MILIYMSLNDENNEDSTYGFNKLYNLNKQWRKEVTIIVKKSQIKYLKKKNKIWR